MVWAQSTLDNPLPDSFQSGIGLISGWSCDTDQITIAIDGQNPVTAAYGTTRFDVAAICDTDAVGFGLTVNWNLFGDGLHTVQAFADGVEFANVSVTVTTLSLGEFPQGLAGECTVANFPLMGAETVLVWQESSQNFVIQEVRNNPSNGSSQIWKPAPGTSWQWQLQGTIDTSFDVDMYDIDLFDAPQSVIDELHAADRIVMCYFSAGTWEMFRSDGADFPASVRGNPLGDFPDERWLDIRQLDVLGPLMRARLDLAVTKNCDGVEPDNVDAYTNNSGFALTAADQLAYNVWLAAEAHARGLSVGLKNNIAQVKALEPHFDWALNEECFAFDECEALLPFIRAGKAVFGVEYTGNPDIFCPQANALNFDWLMKGHYLFAEPYLACRDHS